MRDAFRRHRVLGSALMIVAMAIMAGAAVAVGAQQRSAPGTFGSGHCGPIDPSYVKVSSATGGQVLPLGPNEIAGAAPLMSASSGTETLLWLTSTLSMDGRVVRVPVDGVTSRVSFIASTDNSLTEMVVLDPHGAVVGAGAPDVEALAFGCVRSVTVDRPIAGEWNVRLHGTGTFWLAAHGKTELALEDAAFVHVAGRPGHEGLFRIQGQPASDRPATLQLRFTREAVRSAVFDLVSASGTSLGGASLSPVTNDDKEHEYIGDLAQLPTVPFRVRVTGRDRSGATYQRMSGQVFHAATVEVTGPGAATLRRGQRMPITITVRNSGAAARFQILAVAGATIAPAEPSPVTLGARETRTVTVWVTVPGGSTQSSEDIVVTVDGGSEAASNSTIVHATIESTN